MTHLTGRLPRRIERLSELAYNLFWSWHPEAQRLFERLDPGLWERCEHNPVRLLLETENLPSAAEDAGFVDLYHGVMRAFDDYMRRRDTWMGRVYPDFRAPVAYFSAEFGLHEALPIYSGGLGVLAGDHVKSASDLGVPLVGVGILYAQGYFRQRIEGGVQREVYEPFDPRSRPILPARDPDGGEVVVEVSMPGRTLYLKVWEVRVGICRVLLLDADIPQNSVEDRTLTARLYGGDARTRIAQEIILGVGGVRALRAVGERPAVFHMNEGHAAFLSLERVRELVAAGMSFEEAVRRVAASTVFTTHTPVPAGHDAFSPGLFWEFMQGWPKALGTTPEGLWALGHRNEEWGETFNMTVLAMRLSSGRNAVSAIHRKVTEDMWGDLLREIGGRIDHITNGIHTWSWLSPEMAELFDEYASGRAWREAVDDAGAWSFVEEIPASELWETHRRVKKRALSFASRRIGAGSPGGLDPGALTIGFARRFATYKRATLLLHDPKRLRAICGEGRVQFVFAGKAHPADTPAKGFIRELCRAAEEELSGVLFVLEDYDMNLARHLVQGVDVWLNNPRPPLEASGTSGQKAALNGAPNLSVLDGWWPEAYDGTNGWAVGGEEGTSLSQEERDAADADALYRLLEEAVVPLYHGAGPSGVPEGWVEVMRRAVVTVAPAFSTQRMVRDYVHRLYAPHASSEGFR
ncbi:MAG: alpha-glucan family phosphorylase [Rubrobacteraceae bacterium]|nr:alpha-glucan family phosphorylase [Rubrobacteraceae bacterium]